MKSSMNGKLYDIAYDHVGTYFNITDNAKEQTEFIPTNNNGFYHHEPAISSARTSSTQSKCQNVSIVNAEEH